VQILHLLSCQWREMSTQNSDEPNEEFVLPPPPQFQSDDITAWMHKAQKPSFFFYFTIDEFLRPFFTNH